MTIDYAALWVLVVLNTFAILALIRQVATLPQFSRPSGPRVGTKVEEWALRSLDGDLKRSVDLPPEYTLVFVASSCGPCHTLMTDLRGSPRSSVPLYLVGQGNAEALAKEAEGKDGPLYDLFLINEDGELNRKLGIPGTPYAVSVRDGQVARTGAVPSAKLLLAVAGGPAQG